MWASNFGRTNVPSGIIYMFASAQEADNKFDLLLKDEAGEEVDESYREFQTEMFVQDDYRETIDFVKEKLGLSSYSQIEWRDWTTKIIGYVNVCLYNKESKEWEDGSINVLVEHGYHDGARLDISIEDLLENFPTSSFNKTSGKKIEREIKRIEKVFAEACSIKLKRVGGFSDGTSVYETVS